MADAFVFVTDLAPTILGLVGLDDHGGIWQGREVKPVVGMGFSMFLAADKSSVHDESEPIGYELVGNSALFKGDYKIGINRVSQNDTDWHLYNTRTDPGETTDLARQHARSDDCGL